MNARGRGILWADDRMLRTPKGEVPINPRGASRRRSYDPSNEENRMREVSADDSER